MGDNRVSRERLLLPPPDDDTEGLASLRYDTAMDYLANCNAADRELAKIMHSEFIGNTSRSAAAAGFHDESEARVIECLFEDNVSSSSGGALIFWISGPNLVDRCTFVGNTAEHEGAALWSEKISATYVRSCTFWGNASPDGTVLAGNYQFGMQKTVVAFIETTKKNL